MNKSLPLDNILGIIQFAIWRPTACRGTSQPELGKHKFHQGLANACKSYRSLYMSEWSRHLTLRDVKDWKSAITYGFANHARIVILEESALLNHAAVKAHLDFSRFALIHTLILDCHNDVGCTNSSGAKGQWSYKRIMPSLPKCLKSLVILNAHGPDLQIIQRAIQQCGDLESLSLGRCTKFNRPGGCDFWNQFPNDHDSYFSGKGIEGYASALGAELRGLTKLKFIFVNVYLTDTKYLNHTPRAPAAPSLTANATGHSATPPTKDTDMNEEQSGSPGNEQSQPICSETQDKKNTEEAEETAAKILFKCHPSIKKVGFISYWSPDKLGWSLHDLKAEHPECFLPHKTPDPGGESGGSRGDKERNHG